MSAHPCRLFTASLLTAGMLITLTACSQRSDEGAHGSSGAITVRAGDDSCELTRTSAPTGSITFKITNEGDKITEFYLYSPQGKVVSEVEGIGPGTSRTMTVNVAGAGTYATACKPGMVGKGIRGEFTVTTPAAG